MAGAEKLIFLMENIFEPAMAVAVAGFYLEGGCRKLLAGFLTDSMFAVL
jgi:hypothetical protein